ncbi:MAG: Gfo/Idh/MocA family protein [Bacteroidales bacterium]
MINWGIIGCGKVTEVKSGPAFNKVEGSQLVAVMRRNRTLAEDYAKRHNVPRFYNKAEDLINDPEVNAVYIATPPGSHAKYAIMAIKAGKPVYIEKPMALNYHECEMINKIAREYDMPVFIAYYRRTLPGFLKVKDLIESGAIGKIRFFNIQLFKAPSDEERAGILPWRVQPEISGGGHFIDLASHQIDYLDFLFGPVRNVKSITLNQGNLYKAEDYVSVLFTFNNEITGNGTWCFSLDESSNRDIMEFFGEKGNIKFSCFTFEPIIVTNNYGTKEYINERPENVQYYLIEQIVNELLGKGKAVSDGISGARTTQVMDEIIKDYYFSKC